MQWWVKAFSDLDTNMLFELLKARVDVFVVEQQCPYPELDETDRHSDTKHLILIKHDNICAYARVYEKSASECAIGRVLIVKSERGKGLAKALMCKALEVCEAHFPERDIVLSAQVYLVAFYRSLGFICQGNEYLEDGIPHQDMRLKRAPV
ncbi:GNAT family N-acetyltransferase [Pseudoalteromonas sp. JBTF-M23]|uniref:GNAT family N-acetyltransferase n=1 Tax=Pseudoalteromonas caenipelagi TaxID=2726988 RepID=A0A849VGK0_9GAMM|nr:GNAT family N-acetyltransferase [Pseudoalteromonas caenipelagi]NOU50841.1 GNAT family N-acetyltransferase [Pseudoalteromonas caenipelagi]